MNKTIRFHDNLPSRSRVPCGRTDTQTGWNRFANESKLHKFLCKTTHTVSQTIYKSWFQTFAVYWMLCAFFWVNPRRLRFICRLFGTLCSIFIGIPAYEDGTECSETSAYKFQTPGIHPKERIQQSTSLFLWVSQYLMKGDSDAQAVVCVAQSDPFVAFLFSLAYT